MKKNLFPITMALGFALTLIACGDSGTNSGSEDETGSGDKNSFENSGTKDGVVKMSSMVDPRDGTTYKIARVGTQVWMAENLAFYDTLWNPKMATNNVEQSSDGESGRKYSYEVAMNFAYYDDSLYNDGICPPGWHLPTMAEFDELKTLVTSKCDSTTFCGLAEHGWGGSNTYWTSTSTDYGVRIDTEYGYKYESNSRMAVCYSIDLGGRKPFEPNFSGKSSEMYVRCLLGSRVDSADAMKKFQSVLQNRLDSIKIAQTQLAHDLNGAKNHFNGDLEYSYFTDERDSNVYGYLKIGNYTWMAENLRYAPGKYLRDRQDTIEYYSIGSVYYGSQRDSICPSGWHVPSVAEWQDLFTVADNMGNLMATNSYWDPSEVKPTNTTGFTMLPTRKFLGKVEKSPFNETEFWTSEDSLEVRMVIDTVYTDSVEAENFTLDTTYVDKLYNLYYEYSWIGKNFDLEMGSSTHGLYARCVKDY